MEKLADYMYMYSLHIKRAGVERSFITSIIKAQIPVLTSLAFPSPQNFLFFFTGALAFSSNSLFNLSRFAFAFSTGSSGSAGVGSAAA